MATSGSKASYSTDTPPPNADQDMDGSRPTLAAQMEHIRTKVEREAVTKPKATTTTTTTKSKPTVTSSATGRRRSSGGKVDPASLSKVKPEAA